MNESCDSAVSSVTGPTPVRIEGLVGVLVAISKTGRPENNSCPTRSRRVDICGFDWESLTVSNHLWPSYIGLKPREYDS